MTTEERHRRRFSEVFRKEQVRRIEAGELTIAEVSRLFEVKAQNVRLWLKKFGSKSLPERIIISSSSEVNRLKTLEKENTKLKQIIGEQQIKVLYFEKLVELAKEKLGDDFEKKVKSYY